MPVSDVADVFPCSPLKASETPKPEFSLISYWAPIKASPDGPWRGKPIGVFQVALKNMKKEKLQDALRTKQRKTAR